MKIDMTNKDKVKPYFFLTLLVAVAILMFFIFKPFLISLLMAVAFSVVLYPVYKYFLHKIPKWPSVAVLATMVLSIICIVVPAFFLGSKVFDEAQQLFVTLSESNGDVPSDTPPYLKELIDRYAPSSLETVSDSTPKSFDGLIKDALLWIITNTGKVFSGLAGALFGFLIFLISLYHLLIDGAKFKGFLINLSPLADHDDNLLLDRLEAAVNSVFKGYFVIAVIQGVLSGIGLAMFGVPNPLLFGVMAGLAATVPTFGTALILVPASIFLLVSGSFWSAFGLLIWAAIAVGLIDNLLGPKLIGQSTLLHPLVVLLSILGGISFLGAAGLILGPLCASLLMALLSIYADSEVRNGT